MAKGQDFAQVFQNLIAEFSNVCSALPIQYIEANILKFNGNTKLYREWVKTIDKYAIVLYVQDDRKKLTAFQSFSEAADLLNDTGLLTHIL